MQRAGLAVRAGAAPVIQSIGRVAGLLDLGDEQAGAESVDRAGGNENAVAGLWLEGMEAIFEGAVVQRSSQRGFVAAFFQTGVDAAARLGIEDNPGFGLAEVGRREFGSRGVVGMDLHRKVALAVEE